VAERDAIQEKIDDTNAIVSWVDADGVKSLPDDNNIASIYLICLRQTVKSIFAG